MGTCTSAPSDNQTKNTLLRKGTPSITYSYVFSDQKQSTEKIESITKEANIDNISQKLDNKGIVLVDSTYKLEITQAESTNNNTHDMHTNNIDVIPHIDQTQCGARKSIDKEDQQTYKYSKKKK
eukprot:51073_1